MVRRTLFFALLAGSIVVAGSQSRAQGKPPTGTIYTWNNTPLETALFEFSAAAGVAIVFAHRLVDQIRVSGSYKVGDDPQPALAALLSGSGLLAERIRRGRYVIIAEPISAFLDPDDRTAILGSLRGFVIDADTEIPLWGANVWLIDLDLGGVVNEDGSFEVANLPTGEYLVRFSHVGYKPVRTRLSVFPVSPQRPPTIQLQEEILINPEAIVLPGAEPDPPPGMTELTAQDLEQSPIVFGEPDIVAATSRLPGVSRSGGSTGQMVVRGANPSYVLYLRNGVPMLQPWHNNGAVSSFQPEAAQRVRFHRGSLPPELGNGLAGVMDIETRDGLVERPQGAVSISSLSARAVAEVPLTSQVGLFVAARRSLSDKFFRQDIDLVGGTFVQRSLNVESDHAAEAPRSFYDAEARVTWEFRPGHRLSLDGYVGGDNLQAACCNTIAAFGDPTESTIDDRDRTSAMSARYSYLGRRSFVTATAYRSTFSSADSLYFSLDPVTRHYGRNLSISESGLRIDADYFQSVAHQLRGGIWARRRSLDARLLESETTEADGAGERVESEASASVDVVAYVQDAWIPRDGLSVLAGVRAGVYANGTYVGIDPRLFARWTIVPERFYVRTGVSRQTQSLHQYRERLVHRYDLTTQNWMLSSDATSPSSAWQVGLGLEWAARDWLSINADAYVRRSADILEPINPSGASASLAGPGIEANSVLRHFRQSAGRSAGLELAAEARRNGWLLGLSYSLSATQVQLPGESGWRPSAYDRPHLLGAVVQYQNGGFSGTVRLSLQSGLPNAARSAIPIDGPDRFETEVFADISGAYSWSWQGLYWKVTAQALNIPSNNNVPSRLLGSAPFVVTDVLDRRFLPVVSLSASW